MPIREEIKKIVENNKISIFAVARSCGISPGAVSQYLKGKYTGRNDNMEKTLESFLSRFLEKQKTHVDFKYVETTISRKIHEVARIVHTDCEIGVVCGEAGLGKTFAVRKYAALNPDVILVEVNLSYSAEFLFQNIYQILTLGHREQLSNMVSEITSKLQDSGRLMIIDEAEHLPYKALELLRSLYDQAGIGILLVGLPRLIHNLRGGRGEYQQLYSRVGVFTLLDKLSEADTKEIIASTLPTSNGIHKNFHRISRGNTRTLSKLLRRTVRTSRINDGAEINKDFLEEVAKTLIF